MARFSASKLKLYMSCPLKGHFRYDLHLPTESGAKAAYGSAVHAAIDTFHRTNDLAIAKAKFISFWESPESYGSNIDYWETGFTFHAAKADGLELLEWYGTRSAWNPTKLICSERKFLVPFGEHELMGYVDFVELANHKSGKRLEIVDLKTGWRPPQYAMRSDIQFTVYAYASQQPEFWLGNGPDFPPLPDGERQWAEFADLPRRPIWFDLKGKRRWDAGERTDADFMRLYRVVKEIAHADKMEVWVPKISHDSCNFCDYADPCGLKIDPEPDMEEAI